MAVAAGLSGHDGPLAALPKEIVALLDTQAVVKRIRNNQVSTAIRTQSAHATTFKQLRGIVNPQLHPKGMNWLSISDTNEPFLTKAHR